MLVFWIILAAILLAFIIVFLVKNIRVVRQGSAFVVEQLGKYHTTWQAGLHFKKPFIQKVVNEVSLKERVADFEPQSVITKDNVMIESDSVIYYKVFDVKALTYGVQNYLSAIENLTATTLRSVIGDMTLDESLNSRDEINAKLLTILDDATDPWGIKITRVEIKNITPPKTMRSAMEAEATAERLKRAKILEADGIKEAAIREAEGNKAATVLNAEAEKEKRIMEAEGRARAIEREGEAKANAIKMLNSANPDEKVITLKGFEMLQNAANGESNTIIIPSDMSGIASMTSAIKAISNANDNK